MSGLIDQAIKQSSTAFIELVWPHISIKLGGGELVAVEGVTEEMMAKTFDTVSGIDAWQVFDNRSGVRGIASRVQPSDKDWATFTIRRRLATGRETEWHKRIRAILGNQDGVLYPGITVQAYVHHGYQPPIYSIAYIRTKDLFHAALLHDWEEKQVEGGNTMMVLGWDRLAGLDYHVGIWRP